MNCRHSQPTASVRMFCFPWAGGGANFYTTWGKDITNDIEVFALCLPGRESRFRESCQRNLKHTIDEIVNIICNDYLDKPFIFLGHSLGALLSFLVALELKHLHKKEPLHMILSGSFAPQSVKSKVRRCRSAKSMSKDDFCEMLKTLGGTPQEILNNHELLEIYLPPIQADFCLLEEISFEFPNEMEAPLTCSIDFFDGKEDTNHDYEEWQCLTSGPFSLQLLPGGHFYIKDPVNIKRIINHINERCPV